MDPLGRKGRNGKIGHFHRHPVAPRNYRRPFIGSWDEFLDLSAELRIYKSETISHGRQRWSFRGRERDLPFRENDLEWRRVCKHVVVLSRVSDEITRSRRCLASRREHDRNNDRNRDDGRAIVRKFFSKRWIQFLGKSTKQTRLIDATWYDKLRAFVTCTRTIG